jgi:hypothetical protein
MRIHAIRSPLIQRNTAAPGGRESSGASAAAVGQGELAARMNERASMQMRPLQNLLNDNPRMVRQAKLASTLTRTAPSSSA